MKNPIAPVLLALSLTMATVSATQTVLLFDDVPAVPGIFSIPAGYGGVNWADNMALFAGDQPPFDPQSPPNRVVFNQGPFGVGESVVTFIGGPQVFDGAYFSGLNDVQFNLYSGVTLVATSGILSLGSGSGPTFLASGYAGPVDKVGIVGNRGFMTMDNFTYESVPEPSTFGLIAIGALALGLRPRQRVNHQRVSRISA